VLKKISISALALAAVGFAGAASAQNSQVLTLNVTVAQIAELLIEPGYATADWTMTRFLDQLQGTDDGWTAADGFAVVRLNTNFPVASVDFTYPKVDNIGTFGPGFWFGRAEGSGAVAGEVLGVWPQAAVIPGADLANGWGGPDNIGNNSSSDTAPLVRTNAGGGSFGNGTHLIAIGTSSRPANVPASGPNLFANAGTYSIEVTATINP
jgi:hypothetical protein